MDNRIILLSLLLFITILIITINLCIYCNNNNIYCRENNIYIIINILIIILIFLIFSIILIINIICNNNIKILNYNYQLNISIKNNINSIIHLLYTKIDNIDSNDILFINEKIKEIINQYTSNNIHMEKSIIINDIYNKLIAMNNTSIYKEKLNNIIKLLENNIFIV